MKIHRSQMTSFRVFYVRAVTCAVVWFRQQGDEPWRKGLASTGPSRCMRLLMPLSLALELFRKASIPDFLTQSLFITKLASLGDTHRRTDVRWLRDHPLNQEFFKFVDDEVIWTVFELSHDYQKFMRRIQLNAFGKNDDSSDEWYKAGSQFVRELCDVLQLEKKRQMTASDFKPELAPWEVKDVMSMPFVLWVRTIKKCKRNRQQRKI